MATRVALPSRRFYNHRDEARDRARCGKAASVAEKLYTPLPYLTMEVRT